MDALIGASVLLSNCPRDRSGRPKRGLPFLPFLRPSHVPVGRSGGQMDNRSGDKRTAFGAHGGSSTEG
jgi:hypothetical protein